MSCFLKPIVDELTALQEVGLLWTTPVNKLVTTRVYLDLIVADSVARPLMQNFKQFNGKYGCGFCLHEGEVLDKGLGCVRTFPLRNDVPQLRCHSSCLQHAENVATSNHSVELYGIKGVSVLYLLPYFDFVNGFNPEYMHSVLLGVVRQFVNLWFDSSSHGKIYSLRKHLSEVDDRIVKVSHHRK